MDTGSRPVERFDGGFDLQATVEIGQRLENIPLEVVEVEVVEADDEEENEEPVEAAKESETSAPDDDDDEVLPEFDDLMDE